MSRFPGKKTPIDDVNSKEIKVKRSRKEESVEQILGTFNIHDKNSMLCHVFSVV